MFIDFEALKKSMTIEQAVEVLGLSMKQSGQQLRGPCPACSSDDPRTLVVTPAKGAFYCFANKAGGDLIALAAHIRGESIKDAAVFLAGTSNSKVTTDTSTVKVAKTVPAPTPAPAPAEPDNKLEKVAARLLWEHPEVQALGLTPEMAEALMVGYDKRGMMKGRVLFPLYREDELVGFLGYAHDLQPAVKLPPNLTDLPQTDSKIVRLVPKAG